MALACLPAIALTVLFFSDVRAGLEELLPRSAPSVRALETLHEHLGGKANLVVIAQSDKPEDNRGFITALTEALVKRNPPEARSIQGSVSAERKWIRDHAPMLLSDAEFERAMGEVDDAIESATARANPAFVSLDDKPEDPATTWRRIEAKFEEEGRARDRFPAGFLESEGGRTVVLIIWLEGSETELQPAERLLHAVKEEVAKLAPRFPMDPTGKSGIKIGYQGEVPNLIEEHDAILADLSISTLLVFAMVGMLIVGYFRSLRAVAVVSLGLVPGILLTFALGRLTVGHLNSNTAFLGSIILGNGINYPLLFLAYFRRRDPSEPRAQAIVNAARMALPGTLGAALTASAAYGGLSASTFRGFSQFGWLGGMGMVATWTLTFVTMPIVIALIDPPRYGQMATRTESAILRFFARRRLPLAIAAGFLLVAFGLGGAGAVRAWRTGLYEMDLSTMRNRESLKTGSASYDRTVSNVFGIWMNPVAALVTDPAQREQVADELRRVMVDGKPLPSGLAPAERVESIIQFVKPEAAQAARIARLRKVADRLHKLPDDQIPAKARELINAWFDEKNLRPIAAADVPASLRQSFAEHDGRTDRVVLLYPSLRIDYNNGENVIRFADRLHETKLPEGAVVGGAFLFMAEIIRMVRDEAPRVMVVVCLLVAMMLLPFFLRRPLRIVLAVATVATVAVTAQAVMITLGVKLNMLNFAAVPITIGVGSDYVVNLLGAMDAFKMDARRACARMGGAILLCSMTTVVGYLSLVMAQSGALRTFGWAAVLGEVMAVAVVLLVLPVLMPRQSGKADAQANEETGQAAVG